MRAESGLAAEVEGGRPGRTGDEEAWALVFNRVPELLVNVVKHIRAEPRVTLTRQGRYARVSVADDATAR